MEHSKKGHALRGKFPQHGLPVPFYFRFIQLPAIGCRTDNDWALFQSVDFLNLIGDAVIYHDGKSAAPHKKALLPASFRTILFLPNAAGVKIELMGVVDQLRTAEEKPEQKTQVRTFFNYYLPTSVKLFETYADLTGSGIQTASVTRTKREIEEAAEVLVKAFEKELDGLFAADALDVATDIQVLEVKLSRDGLLDSPFTVGDGEKG